MQRRNMFVGIQRRRSQRDLWISFYVCKSVSARNKKRKRFKEYRKLSNCVEVSPTKMLRHYGACHSGHLTRALRLTAFAQMLCTSQMFLASIKGPTNTKSGSLLLCRKHAKLRNVRHMPQRCSPLATC